MDAGDENEAVATSDHRTPPLGALDLLAIASRAAARVACEQCIAVEGAARLLEEAALNETMVWVAGDAADEHTRRLEAAGHCAIAIVDPNRLPLRVASGDLLFVTATGELPLTLLTEAQRRTLPSIVLTGATRMQGAGVYIHVDCQDERAIELTHSFIVTALCAQNLDLDEAESAA
jgi:hypothetical protein